MMADRFHFCCLTCTALLRESNVAEAVGRSYFPICIKIKDECFETLTDLVMPISVLVFICKYFLGRGASTRKGGEAKLPLTRESGFIVKALIL